jgi:hypothetical protein
MSEERNAYKVLVGKKERKSSSGRCRFVGKDNVKTDKRNDGKVWMELSGPRIGSGHTLFLWH